MAPLLDSAGWKAYQAHLRSERESMVRGVVSSVGSHPDMAKYAGGIRALDDALSWADKVRTSAETARRWFDDNSDSSSDDE